MLRCAASFVTATYGKVGLILQDLHALPLANFAKSPDLMKKGKNTL